MHYQQEDERKENEKKKMLEKKMLSDIKSENFYEVDEDDILPPTSPKRLTGHSF